MASLSAFSRQPAELDQPAAHAEDKWCALGGVAAALADIAEADGAGPLPADATLAERLASASDQDRKLAETGIEDLIAFVEPGVCALLMTHQRGNDMRPAARALLHEIERARSSVIALLEASDQPSAS